jgi:hypothetical protein
MAREKNDDPSGHSWVNVTAHPTAEWITRQITEAFPWNEAPRYLVRDREYDLWHGRQASFESDRYSRQADLAWFSVAELFYGRTDWLDPPRVCRPSRGLRRAALAPRASRVCPLLQ